MRSLRCRRGSFAHRCLSRYPPPPPIRLRDGPDSHSPVWTGSPTAQPTLSATYSDGRLGSFEAASDSYAVH